MARRACARYPLCQNLVERKGYCAECAASRPAARYDEQRESAAKRGYDGKWRKYREAFLRRHPVCVGYPKGVHEDVVVAANEVDHIVPHKGDKRLFWDAGNHQGLCKPCHTRKTTAES